MGRASAQLTGHTPPPAAGRRDLSQLPDTEPLDPASILCQFCGKSWEQVPMLLQAKRRTMDPNTSAMMAVWICDECVAQLGQILAAEPRELAGFVGGRLGTIASDRGSADPALNEQM